MIYELLVWLLETFGIHGPFILAGVAILVGVYYARELAGFLRLAGAWLTMIAMIGGLFGAVLVGGLAVGAIDLDSSVITQLVDMILKTGGF